ncbi:elongation factor P [Candidatus Fukatsuia anoeciicola]|uniref:elongation factor P n=1 Tax=Candidatus Fukatsuia anoeciicola TaxID=2994492 RepID=UPI0034643A7F
MATYFSNEFRSGLKIMLDGEPCTVIDNEFVKPGKGQAFVRTHIRKLISGKLLEKTFKSTDTVSSADVVDINLTYLYNDGKFWHFMNNDNFEQLAVDKKVIAANIKWLVEQTKCVLTLWNGQPITVSPPNFIELKIINTNPGLKGDTTGTSYKPAILSTGAIVKVPLFVQQGEIIKVDTRSGEYISRIK